MDRSLCVKARAGMGIPPAAGKAGWLKWCSARGAPGVSAALHGVCGGVSAGACAGVTIDRGAKQT